MNTNLNRLMIKGMALWMIMLITLSIFPPAEAGPLQQQEIIVGELKPVKLYMYRSNLLSAEAPENGTQTQELLLPKGWECAAWSPRCQFGSAIWMDVGTWKTDSLTDHIRVLGDIDLIAFVQNQGSTTPGDAQLEFSIIYDNKIIGGPVVKQMSLRAGAAMETVNARISINGTPSFQRGDVISLRIRTKISLDGSRIYFGSPEAQSGMSIQADGIKIIDVSACKKEVTVVFRDAFGARWMSPQMQNMLTVYVDGIPLIDNEPDISYQDNGMQVIWKKGIRPGSHKIKASVSYDGSSVWSLEKSVSIPEDSINVASLMPYIIVLLVVVVAAVAYSRSRS